MAEPTVDECKGKEHFLIKCFWTALREMETGVDTEWNGKAF